MSLPGRRPDRPLVIGHRGAPVLAPENTLASFEAAVAAGADLVEFDVGLGLRIGHSEDERPAAEALLGDALELLRDLGSGIQVDLKCVGIERAVVDEARRVGVGEDRLMISTTWARSLRTLAAIAPGIPRALGYPRDRFGAANRSWHPLVASAVAATARAGMPARVSMLLSASRANVLALHHAVVSERVVDAVHQRGAAILVWTVNDPAAVERFAGLRVDAIATDDPGMALQTLATLSSP